MRRKKEYEHMRPENRRARVYRNLSDIDGPLGDFIRFVILYKTEITISLIGIMIGLTTAFVIIVINDFNQVKGLAQFEPSVTTKIYDRNGIFISELFAQKREVVDFEKIPPHLIEALIAIEDNEFYDHPGFNIKGITRAFFVNILAGRVRQGGSTITQQLAKILLTSGDRTIYRKIKEAIIAVMIEFYYTKEEILALYLNQIFLGHGTYGIEAASQLYFDKHVWDLNRAESALLMTLPSAPNALSPIRHTKRSMGRHRIVLAKMVEMGYLSIEEAEELYLAFWPEYLERISHLAPTENTRSHRIDRAPWFTEHVRRMLVRKYGARTVYEQGLLVYTTLDIRKQEAAQEVMQASLEKQTARSSSMIFTNEDIFVDQFSDTIDLITHLFDLPHFARTGSRENERFNNAARLDLVEELEALSLLVGAEGIVDILDKFKETYSDDRELQQVEGALITLDHTTGGIEAMVGGSEFSSINQLNRAIQIRRQVGSSIKPLLYAAAFESGEFTAATTIFDSPVVYLDHEGGEWIPGNYEGEFYGLVSLRRALALSINVVSVRLAEKLGIDYVKKYYGRLLDIDDSRIPREFSISLGSVEVSPLELARAYAVMANRGKDVIPYSIRFVKDRHGALLENREAEVKELLADRASKGSLQVIKPETAELMTSLLRSAVFSGTGSAANPGKPVGGKTGSTNNWRDAWFVGFSPRLTTALWVGYDSLGLSLGLHQSGGSVAAPLWGTYMRAALARESVVDFPPYYHLVEEEVCTRSGFLPSSDCRQRTTELFIPGTVPEDECETCELGDNYVPMSDKRPKENIVQQQHKSVIKKMKSENADDILMDITDDLLKQR